MKIAFEFTERLIRKDLLSTVERCNEAWCVSSRVKEAEPIPGEFYFCFSRKGHVFWHARDDADFVRRGKPILSIHGDRRNCSVRPPASARNDDEWVSLNGGREKRSALGITKAGELRSNANCDSRQRRRLIDRLSVNSEVKTGRAHWSGRWVVSSGSVNKKRIYLLWAASITLMAGDHNACDSRPLASQCQCL